MVFHKTMVNLFLLVDILLELCSFSLIFSEVFYPYCMNNKIYFYLFSGIRSCICIYNKEF